MGSRCRRRIEANVVDFCLHRMRYEAQFEDDDDLEIGWACAATRMGTPSKFKEEDDLALALRRSEEAARRELVERQALAAAMHISQRDPDTAAADDRRLQRLLEGTVAEAFCGALSAKDSRAAAEGAPVASSGTARAASSCCRISAKEPPEVGSSPTTTWMQELEELEEPRSSAPSSGVSACTAAGTPAPLEASGGTLASNVLSELDDSIHAHDALRISAELAEEIRLMAREQDAKTDALSRTSGESEWVDGLDSWWVGQEQLVQESELMRPKLRSLSGHQEDSDWLVVMVAEHLKEVETV